MPPKRKKPESSRNLLMATCRVKQIEVNLTRADNGWIGWEEAIRKAHGASIEIPPILRHQRRMYGDLIRKHRSAPISRKGQDPPPQARQEIEQWYRSAKDDIEDMKGQSELIDAAAEFYQDHLYHAFLTTHRSQPDHPSWVLNERLSRVELLLQELREIAREVTTLAKKLDDRYTSLTSIAPALSKLESVYPERKPEKMVDEWLEQHTIYDQVDIGQDAVANTVPPVAASTHEADEQGEQDGVDIAESIIQAVTTPFRFVDEKVKHKRAATTQTANYVPTGPPTFGSVIRRQGRSVPRIFTGSFGELEGSLREMTKQSLKQEVKSAVCLPVGSKLAGVSSSFPTTSNMRDSSLEDENDLKPYDHHEDEEVVMVSRRGAMRGPPNDRVRARTLPVVDMNGALSSWLSERLPPIRPHQCQGNPQ